MRKPSIRKSISARTKGYATRTVKKALNPTYGSKGTGWLHDPQKAAYNKIYSKTTTSISSTSTHKSTKKASALRSLEYDDSSYKSISIRVDPSVPSDDHHATPSTFSFTDFLIFLFILVIIFLWVWQDFLTALCVGVIILSISGIIAKIIQKRKPN